MTKKLMISFSYEKYFRIAGTVLCLIIATSSTAKAQTTINQEAGLFISPFESFSLSDPGRNPIGPAVGYRFNEYFDLMLHTEFFISGGTLSFVNLGLLGGFTLPLINSLNLRSEIKLYSNWDAPPYTKFENIIKMDHVLGSTSLYWEMPVTNHFTFYPNIGAFITYEYQNYNSSYSSTTYSSELFTDYSGRYQSGPQVGIDTELTFFKSFSITISPLARYDLIYDTVEPFLSLRLNF